jgi:hypothetical protein
MAFYQLKVYRKYTEMPLISFLVDAQSGCGYGYELGRWVQNRHGGEVCLLLIVVVPSQTQKRPILKKRNTANGLTP